jgi:hypothetical protein
MLTTAAKKYGVNGLTSKDRRQRPSVTCDNPYLSLSVNTTNGDVDTPPLP